MRDAADPSAGPADACQLACRLLLVRREHRPEDRGHDVEAAVVERKRLRVALDEVGRHALGGGAHPSPLEERRHVIEPDDRATAPGRRERGIAAPGGDVEHAFAGVDVEGLDEQLGTQQDLGPDHVVVAAGPGGLLALLDGREIRPCRDVGHPISFGACGVHDQGSG